MTKVEYGAGLPPQSAASWRAAAGCAERAIPHLLGRAMDAKKHGRPDVAAWLLDEANRLTHKARAYLKIAREIESAQAVEDRAPRVG